MRAKNIETVQKINALLPDEHIKKPEAEICRHCLYVNNTGNSFCTNCGYPINNMELIDVYKKRIQQRTNLLFTAENSVLVARIVLYVMASFLSLGILFIFAKSSRKYLVVILAFLLSGLFFFLAFWSRKNPFTALLTAFIILITFSAINIFGKLTQSFTTLQGMTGMLLCLAVLFVVLKGVHGAYSINLIKQELQLKL
ncbi:MAG: hypothetical protein ABI405_02465 [Parafilimonas sp.]